MFRRNHGKVWPVIRIVHVSGGSAGSLAIKSSCKVRNRGEARGFPAKHLRRWCVFRSQPCLRIFHPASAFHTCFDSHPSIGSSHGYVWVWRTSSVPQACSQDTRRAFQHEAQHSKLTRLSRSKTEKACTGKYLIAFDDRSATSRRLTTTRAALLQNSQVSRSRA